MLSRHLFFLILLFPLLPKAMNIVVDPGHGGIDRGAVRGLTIEAEVVLNISKILSQKIEEDPELAVTLTRTKDQNLSLEERVQTAHRQKGDLFISIHANASKSKRAQGAEFYFQNQLPPEEDALFLAQIENSKLNSGSSVESNQGTDLQAIIADLKRQGRLYRSHHLSVQLHDSWNAEGSRRANAIQQAPFYVISKVNMPAVLMELGFISNPLEAKRLREPERQEQMAEEIYQGLIKFKQSVKN